MFSIIIPLYNKSSYIKETIESVLNQSYSEYEIIIVDDSSTDNSLEIVRSIVDDRIRVYSKKNEGVSAARNYGIKKVVGDYICFLDADDLWKNNHLQVLYDLISKYPQCGIYSTAYCILNDAERSTEKRGILTWETDEDNIISDYFKLKVQYKTQFCWTSAVCVKKEIIREIHFSYGIRRGEDLDVWTRIIVDNDYAFSNKITAYYRINTSNSLNSEYTSYKDEYPYWEWKKLNSKSPYFTQYINNHIFMLARNAFLNKKYKEFNEIKAYISVKDVEYKKSFLYMCIMSKINLFFYDI